MPYTLVNALLPGPELPRLRTPASLIQRLYWNNSSTPPHLTFSDPNFGTKPFPEPRKSLVFVPENSGLSCMMAATSSVAATPGSMRDAATRLQDFGSLIVEMSASLLAHDCETQ